MSATILLLPVQNRRARQTTLRDVNAAWSVYLALMDTPAAEQTGTYATRRHRAHEAFCTAFKAWCING